MKSRPDEIRRGGLETPGGYVFELTGGHPCLDFANTLDERRTESPRELLADYARLVAWGEQTGLVAPGEARRLVAEAAKHPAAGTHALRRAVATREALFAIFSAIAHGRPVPAEALDELNAVLPRALVSLRVAREGRRFAWTMEAGESGLDAILWVVVRAAAELLMSDQLGRVRECAGDTCAWLFMDRSKNGTRRWCDMSVCGNRAKARRHYRRVKGAARRIGRVKGAA